MKSGMENNMLHMPSKHPNPDFKVVGFPFPSTSLNPNMPSVTGHNYNFGSANTYCLDLGIPVVGPTSCWISGIQATEITNIKKLKKDGLEMK